MTSIDLCALDDAGAHAAASSDGCAGGRHAASTSSSGRCSAPSSAPGADEHVLVLTAHHIVCDGWSWWRDRAGPGRAVRRAAPAPPPGAGRRPSVSPTTRWREPAPTAHRDARPTTSATGSSRFARRVRRCWTCRPTARAGAPQLRARARRPSARSRARRRAAQARRQAAAPACSPRCSARFAALLHRLTGAGRPGGRHPRRRPVGRRTRPPGRPLRQPAAAACSRRHAQAASTQLLDAARSRTLLDAFEHQRYTFGTLLKKLPVTRDPGRLPLVSVLFNVDQALRPASAMHSRA